MKKLLFTLGLVLLTFGVSARNLNTSFLNPTVSFLRVTNTAAITNLNSLSAFVGVVTNAPFIYYSNATAPNTLYLTVNTNISQAGSSTNVIVGSTNQYYGDGIISNVVFTYSRVYGPSASGVVPVTGSDLNFFQDVPVASFEYAHGTPLLTASTNALGTITVTTHAASAVTLTLVVVPLMDGVHESTLAGDQFAFTHATAAAPGFRTTTTVVPNIWPGVKALRLKSLSAGTGGPAVIVDVSFSQYYP